MKPVWIIDDDRSIRWVFEKALTRENIAFKTFSSADEALGVLASETPQVVVSDIRMPGESGLELLQKAKARFPHMPVIIMTAYSDLESAVAAFQGGAYEYLPKPFDVDHAVELIRRALEESMREDEVVETPEAAPEILGQAPAMQEVFRVIGRLAQSHATVLITGDSGTGKELVASALHRHSPRAAKPFIAINTAAIPKDLLESELFGHERGAFTGAQNMRRGRFEQADGGTLFLDEIGELSPFLQAKLLRVLEDQVIRRVGGVRDIQVDVRVIAASNRDLERAVREGPFRQDLYYRLAIISIFIPPLRERKEDILVLVEFFIEHYNRKFRKSIRGISEETRRLMLNYDWPGNVRELKNAIERAMILEEEPILRPTYLPFSVAQPHAGVTAFEHTSSPLAGGKPLEKGRWLPPLVIPEGGTSLEEVERALVELALRQADGNQTHAARLLDISRDALRYKMKKFGLMHADEEESSPANP